MLRYIIVVAIAIYGIRVLKLLWDMMQPSPDWVRVNYKYGENFKNEEEYKRSIYYHQSGKMTDNYKKKNYIN